MAFEPIRNGLRVEVTHIPEVESGDTINFAWNDVGPVEGGYSVSINFTKIDNDADRPSGDSVDTIKFGWDDDQADATGSDFFDYF